MIRNQLKVSINFLLFITFIILCIPHDGLAFLGLGKSKDKTVSSETAVSIAVLSHTDFLPDATGVYDRRSWLGRDKDPVSAANNDVKTGSDQAYDQVARQHEYDPEAVGLPEILADAILENLTNSKRFTPIERKALRTAVLEQRFGKEISKSYLDRTLDKAIQDMDQFEIGGGVAMGHATAGAKYDDLLHDFKDLGSSIGARYLVLGNLHQLGSSLESTSIPLSERGRTVNNKVAEARLRLRVIDTTTSTVLGADSLHLKVSRMLFEGGKESRDDFEFMDQISQDAANKILDIIFPAKIVSTQPLVISRGSNDGVVADDIFSIVREGQEIKETSGTVIARLKEPIGKVKAVTVQETVSVVEPTEGGDFADNDLVVREVKPLPANQGQSNVALQPAAGSRQQGLPRIAIGLVKAGSTAKTGPDAGKHVAIFTDTIITRLAQSKRFTVIDRQEVDQLLDEQLAQALAENRDLPSAIGTLKGCDYLMIGALQNFSLEEQTLKLPNSSRVIKVLDGFAEGNMRLVDARSGDIMESRKITVRKQLEMQAGEDRLTTALADIFAEQAVAHLLNAVYPIKIAAVSPDGTMYINRGSDGKLNPGAIFDVMRPGQQVVDPDSNVALGSMDNKVGQLELTEIEENRSLAKQVDGGQIQNGDLLKMVKAGEEAGEESNEPQRTGGVLPGTGTSGPNTGTAVNAATQKPLDRATLALAKITLNARQKFDDSSQVSAVQQGTMDQITDSVVDALDKTNRFTMMERREVDQVIDEKTFNAITQGTDIRDYLKELAGSDYLVAGELTNFYVQTVKTKVPYLDEFETKTTGFIEGNQRIIDSHSGKIVATEKVRIKKEFKNIGLEEILTTLMDMYATDAATGIVDRIYPVKILAVQPDGTIFINRGADAAFVEGNIFTVERPGEEMIDPDTNISFGAAETSVGELKLTSIEASRSRAVLVTGGPFSAGDILRNKKTPKRPLPPPKMKVAW